MLLNLPMASSTTKQDTASKSKKKYWIIGAVIIVAVVYFILNNPFYSYSGSKKILVIGHAGSGFFSPINPFNPLPSNSMASIVRALEEDGADGIEVDVQLSQDGVPVLYHDVDLESMTDIVGKIDQLPADQVIGLEYRGGFFYEFFHDERIISLETLLQKLKTYPELPYLHLDLRNTNPDRRDYYAQTLMAMLRKYNYPLVKMMFISPDTEMLEAFKRVEPDATLLVDMGESFNETLETILAHELDGICANGKIITEEQVAKAKQHDLLVVLFGGKSRSRISKMLATEPEAIQVNHVEAMRNMLD
ncbi:glycerophosphodiester phosphodiesterase [Pontibacter silvestris]|uniref:Glycerophosphodiester phosphodiesterase n=2 Tax=Pontibacter silvestris TaxID=2305183 RepID=A0ABW4WXR8_9BACT|nr:glycerophosphodiester phosphodiesterase family protein [Pontibacter silvestris]MCC9136830.1 glycerophosphodiester phosphodiesterase [Pontibacter silvestris]